LSGSREGGSLPGGAQRSPPTTSITSQITTVEDVIYVQRRGYPQQNCTFFFSPDHVVECGPESSLSRDYHQKRYLTHLLSDTARRRYAWYSSLFGHPVRTISASKPPLRALSKLLARRRNWALMPCY